MKWTLQNANEVEARCKKDRGRSGTVVVLYLFTEAHITDEKNKHFYFLLMEAEQDGYVLENVD